MYIHKYNSCKYILVCIYRKAYIMKNVIEKGNQKMKKLLPFLYL